VVTAISLLKKSLNCGSSHASYELMGYSAIVWTLLLPLIMARIILESLVTSLLVHGPPEMENGSRQGVCVCIMIGNAQCWRDNAEIITNIFGTILNDDLKSLPSCCISIVESQEAKFGENVAAQEKIPINLFKAGDIQFYTIGIGKEGMSGWWCRYCKLFNIIGKKLDMSGASHEQLKR
jgi:hypothetical protein